MICPMKLNITYVENQEKANCDCEKEKCAWWNNENNKTFDDHSGETLNGGRCSILSIAKKQLRNNI